VFTVSSSSPASVTKNWTDGFDNEMDPEMMVLLFFDRGVRVRTKKLSFFRFRFHLDFPHKMLTSNGGRENTREYKNGAEHQQKHQRRKQETNKQSYEEHHEVSAAEQISEYSVVDSTLIKGRHICKLQTDLVMCPTNYIYFLAVLATLAAKVRHRK